MKKKIALLGLLFCFILISAAQNVKKENVIFNYTQLPLEPVDKNVKNYTRQIIVSYEDEVKAEKEEYERKVQEAETRYKEELNEWERQCAEARVQYEKERERQREDRNKKKLIEKLLIEEKEQEPLVLPPKPYLRKPRAPKERKIYAKELLASSYLKLYGFNNSNDNSIKYIVTLYGYDNAGIEIKKKERSRTKDGKTTKYYEYWYKMSYRHPMSVKVLLPDGKVLLNETIEEFNEYSAYKSKRYESKGELATKTLSERKTLDEKIIAKNLKKINEMVNDKYGFPNIERKATVYTVKSKKAPYPDYTMAFNEASSGYKLLTENKDKAIEKITKAVKLWNEALEESEPDYKKARINLDVTIITFFNLAEAYIWLDDFEKANVQLNKVSLLKLSKREQKRIDNYKKFNDAQQKRFNVNK